MTRELFARCIPGMWAVLCLQATVWSVSFLFAAAMAPERATDAVPLVIGFLSALVALVSIIQAWEAVPAAPRRVRAFVGWMLAALLWNVVFFAGLIYAGFEPPHWESWIVIVGESR